MPGRSEPGGGAEAGRFDEVYRKLLGIDESFTVKSHYPGRLAAERNLVESEARLLAMFEAVPFDMYLLGASGRYVLLNDAFKRRYGDRTGLEPERSGVNAEIRSRYLEHLRSINPGTGDGGAFSTEILEGDRWLLVILAPVLIGGRESGVVGVNIDVSERKRSAEAMDALNKTLERRVEERTYDLSLAKAELEDRGASLERALADLREAQDSLVATRYQASMGRVLASIAHELNGPLASTASAASHLASIRAEAASAIKRLRLAEGGLAELTDRLIGGLGEAGRVDRRDRARMAASLAAAGSADPEGLADDLADLGLRELSEAETALIAGPGGPQAIADAWTLGSLFSSSSLAAAAAERSAGVVRSLDAYISLPGLADASLSEFDLAERIRGSAALAGSSPPLRFDIEDGLAAYGDADRLDLVWENLVKNAVHAAGRNGRVEVSARATGSGVVVRVEDDGPGVDPAIRDRLFESWFTTKGTGEGKGIGLDLCRRIVDTHRGEITFESDPGRTVFTVRLPGKP